MTREDIQAEPWIGEQRERVSALLDRAEVAERGVMSLRAELEAAREFGNAECDARMEAQAEVARLKAAISTVAWQRGDPGLPDVPVVQERYDALKAEVARLTAERDEALLNCKRIDEAEFLRRAEAFDVSGGAHLTPLGNMLLGMRSDLAAERAATALLSATVTTLTEQRDLCATEAERMRAALTGVRKRVDFVFGTTQNVMWERFLHEQRESIDAALVSPSTAARVLRDRDERVRCETKTALEEENP